MKRKLVIALCSGVLLSACNAGSDSTTTTSVTPNVGQYAMSVIGERTGLSNIQCIENEVGEVTILTCPLNSIYGELSIGFTYQGTPGFYVTAQTQSNEITLTSTPYDFTSTEDTTGEVVTVAGNCNSTTPQSTYSCDVTLNMPINGVTQATTVDFNINGQAGESMIYRVVFAQ